MLCHKMDMRATYKTMVQTTQAHTIVGFVGADCVCQKQYSANLFFQGKISQEKKNINK